MAIDVDDQGVVWYRLARPFSDVAQAAPGEPERVRVGEAPGPDALPAEDDDLGERQVRH